MWNETRLKLTLENKESLWLAMEKVVKEIKTESITASFSVRNVGEVQVGRLSLQMYRKDPWDISCFAEEGVKLYLRLEEKPERITAMYLFNPWWTRPAFVKSFVEIPEKTQVLFLEYKDHYSCILPLVGERGKNAICPGTEEEICFCHMGETGMTRLDEDIFLMSEGSTLTEAVMLAFDGLREKEGFLAREDRRLPEMFQYLGWCSWDAFYKEISAEKLIAKADEFREKKMPVRWMLFDDGWMKAREDMISDFLPDKEKFPSGFAGVIDQIKADNSMMDWFGLWHAFAGYWAGVTPESDLAENEKDHLYLTRTNRLIPHPQKGEGFYRSWYEALKEEKIDFVKVDGQSAGPFLFHDDLPLAEGVRGMHRQLEAATPVLKDQVINCMGMAMESIVSRKKSCVSRNSDDFCPKKENGFAEHLLQNAYNAIYHNEMYVCDWDMFWTTHEDAIKHAIIRAISGGPIYFSDKIGQSDPELVKKLVLSDGRILPMDRAAKPAPDCLFTDPMKEGIFKLQNTAHFMGNHIGGVLAIFNLTKDTQIGTISPADIEGIEEAEEYWLYDFFSREATLIGRDERRTLEMGADGYAYYIILPKLDRPVSLGLVEKFTGFVATDVDGNVVEEGPVRWLE